jgi:hypothetical protein
VCRRPRLGTVGFSTIFADGTVSAKPRMNAVFETFGCDAFLAAMLIPSLAYTPSVAPLENSRNRRAGATDVPDMSDNTRSDLLSLSPSFRAGTRPDGSSNAARGMAVGPSRSVTRCCGSLRERGGRGRA